MISRTGWSAEVECFRSDIIDAFRDWQEFGHFSWCPVMDPMYAHIGGPECDCSIDQVEDLLDDYTESVIRDLDRGLDID